jgi:hypothetical protein
MQNALLASRIVVCSLGRGHRSMTVLPVHSHGLVDTQRGAGELSPGKPLASTQAEPEPEEEDHLPMTEAELREHQRHLQEEERLRNEVRRKEEQLRTLTVGPQVRFSQHGRRLQLRTLLTRRTAANHGLPCCRQWRQNSIMISL